MGIQINGTNDVISAADGSLTILGTELKDLSQLNVTGVATAASLVVSGNASIGGTITYMDVSNVDSVGIITAQQGLQVLANGLDVTGVSTFKNNVRVNSGTVGVNTTAVAAQLEVHAAASKINTATIKTSAGAGGYAGLAFMAGQTSAGREKAAIYFQETNNGAHYTGDIVFALNSDSGSAAQVETSDERVRITSSGLVGIGTDSPSRRLHVNSGSTDTAALFYSSDAGVYINFQDSTSAASGVTIGGTGDDLRFGSGGGGEFARIDSSGDVGIGTATPRSALDLAEKTDAVALPQGTTAQRPTGDNPYLRWNTTNSALEFYNGTDWVEIISDYFPSGSTIFG